MLRAVPYVEQIDSDETAVTHLRDMYEYHVAQAMDAIGVNDVYGFRERQEANQIVGAAFRVDDPEMAQEFVRTFSAGNPHAREISSEFALRYTLRGLLAEQVAIDTWSGLLSDEDERVANVAKRDTRRYINHLAKQPYTRSELGIHRLNKVRQQLGRRALPTGPYGV